MDQPAATRVAKCTLESGSDALQGTAAAHQGVATAKDQTRTAALRVSGKAIYLPLFSPDSMN